MDRPFATYSPTSTTARNAEAAGVGRTHRTGGYRNVETGYYDDGSLHDYDAYDTPYGTREPSYGSAHYDAAQYDDAEYDDAEYDPEYEDVYEYEDPIDRRWIWVAGVAAAILLIAVICTVVILGGGDSGAVSKTIAAPTPTSTTVPQDAVKTTAPPLAPSAALVPAPTGPLSPETVTTIAPSVTATTPPMPPPAAAAPSAIAPVSPVSPQTVTYLVTGKRPLLDMVTIVYTDAQGALQTEFNVALPWVKSVTLDPGVELKSVTATSLTGQLNCQISDASGATLVAQNTGTMIASCTK